MLFTNIQESGFGGAGAGKRSRMGMEDGSAQLLGWEMPRRKASSVDICET